MTPEQIAAINALTEKLEKTNQRLADWLRSQAKSASDVISSRKQSIKLSEEEMDNAIERNKIEKDRLEILRERAEQQNRSREVADLNLDIITTELDIQNSLLEKDRERLVNAQQTYDGLDSKLQLLENEKKEAMEIYRLAIANGDTMDDLIAARRIALELDAQIRDLKVEAEQVSESDLETLAAQLEIQKQLVKQKEKEVEHAEKVHHAQETIATDFEAILSASLGLNKDWETTTIAGKLSLLSEGGAESEAAMDKLGESMGKLFSKGTILVALFSKVVESTLALAVAQSEATTQIQRTTGVLDGYADSLSSLHQMNRVYGVSVHEAAEAISSLQNEVLAFSDYTREARDEMATLAALMAETGIETNTTAAAFQYLTAGLAMSGKEAGQTSLEIMQLATDIGVPPQKLLQELARTGPQLAAYGDEAVDVFLDMAVAAKALKMEIGELLEFTSQFDTFEGAATAVGKLNAIMGGNFLNSIEMVGMKEEERVEEVIKAMDAYGKSFDQMEKYERRAWANAAGIRDIATANKILGMSLSAYEEYAEKNKEAALTQEQLAQKAAKFQSIVDKLTNAFMSFGIAMGPIISLLGAMLSAAAKIINTFTTGAGPVVAGLIAISFGMETMAAASLTLGKAIGKNPIGAMIITIIALKAGMDALIEILPEFATGIRILGAAIGFMAVKWFMLTAAASPWLAIAAAIAAAFSLVHDVITEERSPALWFIFGVIATQLDDARKAMEIILSPIKAISSAFVEMATAVRDVTESIANLVFNMADLSLGAAISLGIVLGDIGDLVQNVDVDKAAAVTLQMDSFAAAATAATAITPEAITNTREFVQETTKFYEQQSKAKTADMDPLVQILTKLLGLQERTARSQAAAAGQPRDVVVKIKEEAIGRASMKYIEEKLGF